jgi:tetratricopeptide (TPR) repeat protein
MQPPSTNLQQSVIDEVRSLYARRDWIAIVERMSGVQDDQVRAEPELAFCFADALLRVGETERALALAEQTERAARQRGDRRLLLNVINVIGVALFEVGRNSTAEERFAELLDLASSWKDEEFAARSSNNLGVLANVHGRRDQALMYYQRALASYHRLGYLRGLAQTHHNLGISYRDLGFDREADTHFLRAIQYAQSANHEDVIALAETERALLRARSGDGGVAEALAQRALDRFVAMGDELGRAEALRVLAAAARAQARDEAAAGWLEDALAVARRHQAPLLSAEVQRDRGLLLRDRGQIPEAAEALHDSASHFLTLGAAAEAEAVRAIAVQLSSPDPPSG